MTWNDWRYYYFIFCFKTTAHSIISMYSLVSNMFIKYITYLYEYCLALSVLFIISRKFEIQIPTDFKSGNQIKLVAHSTVRYLFCSLTSSGNYLWSPLKLRPMFTIELVSFSFKVYKVIIVRLLFPLYALCITLQPCLLVYNY